MLNFYHKSIEIPKTRSDMLENKIKVFDNFSYIPVNFNNLSG